MAEYQKKKGIRVRAKKPRSRTPVPAQPADAYIKPVPPPKAPGRQTPSADGLREDERLAQRQAQRQTQTAQKNGPSRLRPGVPVEPYTGTDDFPDLDRIDMRQSREYKEIKRIRQLEKPPVKRMPKRRAADSRAFQVVKGGKAGRRVRLIVSLALAAALVMTVTILHFSAPVGLVEWIQNAAAAAGPGDGFPVTLSDEQPESIRTVGNDVLVLSGALLEAYNKHGRQIYSRQHGFASPALTASASRALVYDRGGTGIKIYNNHQVVDERKLDNSILTAAVGRNGACAFVTKAQGYAAQVSVVDKSFSSLYNWWSAEELISAVALSDNGRRVAAAALKAEGGQYVSTLYIFDISKNAPVAALSYGSAVIAGLESHGGRITVVTDQSISTVDWDCEGSPAAGQDGRLDYPLTGELRQAHTLSGGTAGGVLVVTGRSNDVTLSRIALLDGKGSETASFTVEGNLKYAAFGGGFVYCLFDHQVKAYMPDGTPAGEWDCGYAAAQLTASAGGQALVLESGKLLSFGPPEKPASSAAS